jgi:hypothetical protein
VNLRSFVTLCRKNSCIACAGILIFKRVLGKYLANPPFPNAPVSLQAGGILKKTLALVVLTGLMLTGCATKQASSQPTATPAASGVAEHTVEVPDVVGLTLDKATDQLKDLGLKVEAKDVKDDKSIIVKKNWQVISEDPVGKSKVTEGSTIKLGVKHLTEETPTPTPTPTPTQAPVPLVAPVAPVVEAPPVVAPPVVEEPPVVAPPVAPPVVEAPPVVPPPAAVYYANCAAVRAAGAAPIHISQPGYGRHLDRDGDGWGCDK